MIIGKGMLARHFSFEFANDPDVVIYAKGVSNSGCADPLEFARDRTELIQALNDLLPGQLFVYFGTCSIYDFSVDTGSPYKQHKLNMETIVSTCAPKHLILRLPNVVGVSNNRHLLLNNFYNKLISTDTIKVWRNATRNIIDADDVVLIAEYLIRSEKRSNCIINVANPISYSVTEILSTLIEIMGIQSASSIEYVERGSPYKIDTAWIKTAIEVNPVNFGPNYLRRTLAKYYSPMT